MRMPRTPDEWQEAVDWAQALLALDAARQFGLVTGGPDVNAARCLELLDRGGRRGVTPRPDCIEGCLHALMERA